MPVSGQVLIDMSASAGLGVNAIAVRLTGTLLTPLPGLPAGDYTVDFQWDPSAAASEMERGICRRLAVLDLDLTLLTARLHTPDGDRARRLSWRKLLAVAAAQSRTPCDEAGAGVVGHRAGVDSGARNRPAWSGPVAKCRGGLAEEAGAVAIEA